jgi:hypothetical protein
MIQFIQPDEMQIDSPLEYQVFQRTTSKEGPVRFAGRVPRNCNLVSIQVFDRSDKAISMGTDVQPAFGSYATTLVVPAGGWYRADILYKHDDQVLTSQRVPTFGVGEVFLGAGQSNSTNSGGDGRLETVTKMVSTFSGTTWRLAHDPQPGVHDWSGGGSFWPAFGDAMALKYQVPIGIAVTGHGGTSIRQWQRNGELYQWFMVRLLQFGPSGVRGVLWHQGESDVGMSVEQYSLGMAQIVKDCRAAAGWEVPWFVARVSYHSPERPSFDSTRAAHKLLWDSGLVFEGPDTDTLGGDHRDAGGKGIHFSVKGLRAHGQMWAEKVGAVLDTILNRNSERR